MAFPASQRARGARSTQSHRRQTARSGVSGDTSRKRDPQAQVRTGHTERNALELHTGKAHTGGATAWRTEHRDLLATRELSVRRAAV